MIKNTQTSAKSSHRIFNFLSLTASLSALLSVVWIIIPAPSYYVWLFSVAASEWSLAFGALAIFGILCTLIFGCGKIKFASLLFGTTAVLISLYPFFSAFSAAQKQGVSLSLRQYAGFSSDKEDNAADKQTFTFITIDEKLLQLDLYLPPNDSAGNGAGIVVVHGGSWSGGARSDFPEWNRWLARQGYAVFDIDYRIAPQPNYLSATGDVKCAVGWVKRNAARFNISPDKIVLLGRSAGAHLALLAAYSANDARIPSSCPNPEINENVRAVVSFYAPTDLIWSFDNPANEFVIDGQKTLSQFLGGSPDESNEIRQRFLLASPNSHVTRETPPTLLIHGGQDQLIKSENMNLLARQLEQADVPHKVLFVSYAQHGFDYNFNGWGAQVVQPVLLDFLHATAK
ncbi:MAG: alpha/beta hydrolase [Acidobacteriota bacterium]|nr:alpha/beta hydrolase [Acidobacteriota bacterium]